MSRKIHKRFVEISTRVSLRLSQAIDTNGPVKLTARNDVPLVEVLCRVVVGQQLSTKAASTIWGRVVASAATEPLAGYLADVDVKVLRSCGLSNSKALSMKAIIAAYADGMLDVETLRRQDYAGRSAQLTGDPWSWTVDGRHDFAFLLRRQRRLAGNRRHGLEDSRTSD